MDNHLPVFITSLSVFRIDVVVAFDLVKKEVVHAHRVHGIIAFHQCVVICLIVSEAIVVVYSSCQREVTIHAIFSARYSLFVPLL